MVVALCDKSRDHTPYRQSKLTNVLKDSLGGNCRTTMVPRTPYPIVLTVPHGAHRTPCHPKLPDCTWTTMHQVANIWGEGAHIEETISTLKFASRMMRVQNQARPFRSMPSGPGPGPGPFPFSFPSLAPCPLPLAPCPLPLPLPFPPPSFLHFARPSAV